MKTYFLQINHLKKPIGITGKNLRFSWKVEDCLKQSAFQVVVKDAAGRVKEDSGRIASSDTFYQLQNKLSARSAYRISVTAFDEKGMPSEPNDIEVVTGLRQNEMTAKWINPEVKKDPDKKNNSEQKNNPGQKNNQKELNRGAYLVRRFTLSEAALAAVHTRRAFLYATAHGLMDIYLNGKVISDYCLMPGTQQYDKRLMVEALEVTDLLQAGENEMIVTLGDGWYRGPMGNNQVRNCWGTDIAFLAQLDLLHVPGSDARTLLITDESWMATSEGPLGVNDFMKGEEYDATRTLDALHPVKVEKFPKENLIPVDTVPMTVHEQFSAQWIPVPNGEKVLDFGQNIAGYVKFTLEGKAGQKLVLTHGETLDQDGNFTIQNFNNAVCSTDQKITYICKDGTNTYHPTKTYMGFRYVKVEADFEIDPSAFTACAVYSDIDVLSTFECGVPEVNQLFQNALWSMKGNFIDVPTDCPTREKSGYSGDCQAYVHTAMYLMDCYPVYAKWLRENAAGQYKDGMLPQISPKPCKPDQKHKMMGIKVMDGGIGWSDAFEIILYRMCRRYGDNTLLSEHYEALKKWTEYEIRRAAKTHQSNHKILPKEYRKYMIDTGWMWGEWLEPCQDDKTYMSNLIFHGDPEVGTAFFYQHLKYTESIAEKLGYTEDAARYHDLAEKAREAYRAVYTENGTITEKSRQCRMVRPIAHNLLSEEEKAQAAAALAGAVAANGSHLGTGFLTTHELCRVLSDYGQVKTAYDLLLQEDMPSFLFAVKRGCTTIPESWDCYGPDGKSAPKNSFNHYSYGAVSSWLIDSACGIRVADGQITIEPKPDERLGYASASYDSPYGKISSSWKYEESDNTEKAAISYTITIPANTTALIKLPDGREITVGAGTYCF